MSEKTDIERLRDWMYEHKITKKRLARELGVSYHTIYGVIESRATATPNFVTLFVRRYGADEASRIFLVALAPIAAFSQA